MSKMSDLIKQRQILEASYRKEMDELNRKLWALAEAGDRAPTAAPLPADPRQQDLPIEGVKKTEGGRRRRAKTTGTDLPDVRSVLTNEPMSPSQIREALGLGNDVDAKVAVTKAVREAVKAGHVVQQGSRRLSTYHLASPASRAESTASAPDPDLDDPSDPT